MTAFIIIQTIVTRFCNLHVHRDLATKQIYTTVHATRVNMEYLHIWPQVNVVCIRHSFKFAVQPCQHNLLDSCELLVYIEYIPKAQQNITYGFLRLVFFNRLFPNEESPSSELSRVLVETILSATNFKCITKMAIFQTNTVLHFCFNFSIEK